MRKLRLRERSYLPIVKLLRSSRVSIPVKAVCPEPMEFTITLDTTDQRFLYIHPPYRPTLSFTGVVKLS